jgi:hypothetical protein
MTMTAALIARLIAQADRHRPVEQRDRNGERPAPSGTRGSRTRGGREDLNAADRVRKPIEGRTRCSPIWPSTQFVDLGAVSCRGGDVVLTGLGNALANAAVAMSSDAEDKD